MHRLVIALTSLAGLVGAGALAYLFLFNAPADPAAELAPADTAVYLAVSLQPSSGQDANIARLASRLPGFADTSTLDEKIDELVQNLLAQSGIDYRRDVKPWLGRQVAVAMPAGPDAAPTLLVAVRDLGAAQDALRNIEAGRGEAFQASSHDGIEIRAAQSVAYAFVADTLVLGPDAAAVEAVIDVHGGAESLADRSDFDAAIARLPADRIAALYLDLEALIGQESRYRSAAGALVVEPQGLVLRGRADAPTDDAGGSARPAASESATLTAWMPADTQVAVAAFDGAELLFSVEAALSDVTAAEGLIQTLQSARALFAFGIGLDLDELLSEVLQGEGGLALQGLDADAPSGQLLLRPDDPAAAAARLEDLADRLADSGASVEREQRAGAEIVTIGLAQFGSLAYAVIDEVIIVGLDAAAVEAAISAHESGESLASRDAYAAAFALAGTRTGNELFVDPRVLLEVLGLADGLPAEARDMLDQLGAVAVTLPDRGDYLEFHAVLTVD